MMSAAVELDADPPASGGCTPPRRDLRPAIRRLVLSVMVFAVALGAARYGHQWWTVVIATLMVPPTRKIVVPSAPANETH